MPEPVRIAGRTVVLTTTVAADRADLVRIRLTPEVSLRWRGEDLETEFAEDLADEEVSQLTIRDESGTRIGLIQYSEENDPDYRHASIDIYLDPAVHRRGYARDAITALADYLFDERGHHRLTIDPAADNVAAIGCYAQVGFQPVGVLRQYERQGDGLFADGLLMDMLATDRGARPR